MSDLMEMEQLEPVEERTPVELKKLQQWHKTALSLLAQGLGRGAIAEACDCTPEYITMLAKQPVCQAYLKEMQEFADTRFQALTEQSVEAIADTLVNGGIEEKLKAARLQMEATGRVGKTQSINIKTSGGLVQILAGIPPESRRLAQE